ncbi:MAG: hypothetical protein WBQ25_12510 [Nitrososphaeraceae archaeon]
MDRTTTALIIIAAVVLIATTVAQIQTRVSSSTPEIAGLSAKNIVNASNNLHNRVYSLLLNGDKIENPSPKLAEAVAGDYLLKCVRIFVDPEHAIFVLDYFKTKCDGDVSHMVITHSFVSNHTLQGISQAYLKFRGIQ